MIFKSNNKLQLKPLSECSFNNDDKPMVSICVGTYNQIEYISECLDSILSQLVNFKVEVLINDDASTDGTIELLKQYQAKYPNIIKLYVEQENQFSKKNSYDYVYRIHASRINGKYVALLDSDDYYCDNMAIYTKVMLLEKHNDCNACFSRVRKINNNNRSTIELMPKFHLSTGKLSSKKIIDMFAKKYCFQTSSYFFKARRYIDYCNNYPLFAQAINVFDEPVVMYFGSLGNTYYINKTLSIYRKYSANSWSNKSQENTKEHNIENLEKRIKYLNEFNLYTEYKYNKSCLWGISHSKVCILTAKGNINEIFKDKNLSNFYRKRYLKEYIILKVKTMRNHIYEK